MFTGIVAAVGEIAAMVAQGDGARVSIACPEWDTADVAIGDSVAVGGCCLTLVERDGADGRLAFDVSAETLRCTTGFTLGRQVNLEKALRLADRLGGHLMTGHVDGIGTVRGFDPVTAVADDAGSMRLVVEAPAALARFIAPKGSIAIDGVSLTVNAVAGAVFEVNLIPHTLAVTTLRTLAPGATVNLEVDLVARYVARYLDPSV